MLNWQIIRFNSIFTLTNTVLGNYRYAIIVIAKFGETVVLSARTLKCRSLKHHTKLVI